MTVEPGSGTPAEDLISRLIDQGDVVTVVLRYATALDTKDWPLLETCFTEAAHIDYNTGVEYDRAEFVLHCQDGLTPMLATQHSISNHVVEVDGDTARATAYVHAHHVKAHAEDFVVEGVYRDELIRTPEGWRISDREFVPTWKVGSFKGAADMAVPSAGGAR